MYYNLRSFDLAFDCSHRRTRDRRQRRQASNNQGWYIISGVAVVAPGDEWYGRLFGVAVWLQVMRGTVENPGWRW